MEITLPQRSIDLIRLARTFKVSHFYGEYSIYAVFGVHTEKKNVKPVLMGDGQILSSRNKQVLFDILLDHRPDLSRHDFVAEECSRRAYTQGEPFKGSFSWVSDDGVVMEKFKYDWYYLEFKYEDYGLTEVCISRRRWRRHVDL